MGAPGTKIGNGKEVEDSVATESAEAAEEAGLHYVSDDRPGYTRKARNGEFEYLDTQGKPIREEERLLRIRRLAIPPAWTDVWICPSSTGHIQATGRDARRRKQYRYHERWRELRDVNKFDRLADFAKALPKNRRVTVTGPHLRFRFRGKSGRQHEVDMTDRRTARIVSKCQDLPGQDLFQYVSDDGEARNVTSQDVNDYLREITNENFTAKDFRTWAGTLLTAIALNAQGAFETKKQAKANVKTAVCAVAQLLGNTPAICRKCYVHSAVVEAYLGGRQIAGLGEAIGTPDNINLRAVEAAVLKFLRARRDI